MAVAQSLATNWTLELLADAVWANTAILLTPQFLSPCFVTAISAQHKCMDQNFAEELLLSTTADRVLLYI